MDQRVVSLQAFINARKNASSKKLNELLDMEADDEKNLEDIKLRGLTQLGESFVLQMALSKKAQWGGIWRSVKTIDKDSNGFVFSDELEEIFREWFPMELEGKSLSQLFKHYSSVQNKSLINYKSIKEHFNAKIMTFVQSND
jgi:hypothetical protein